MIMKTVLDLSSTKAFRYFMEPGNYCTQELPVYINFKPVLDFVEKTLEGVKEETVLDGEKPWEYEGINHKLLIKKDAKYTFRPIHITNPYMYYLLVRMMTEKGSWKKIKDRFKQFQRPQIEVSSIPRIKRKEDKSHKSAGVFSWWENMEQRSLALGLQYKYLFVTDITNCYASIYTHTIAWALMGKEEAGRKRFDKRPMDEQDIEVLIAIFTEVALGSPKVYKLVLHLISYLVDKLATTEERERVVRSVYRKFNMIPNIGELQIWMQHITYQMPEGIDYTEPLCKVVAGDKKVKLWNNDWVKKEYRKGFPQSKICTEWIRDSFTPVIDIDEVSLFELY